MSTNRAHTPKTLRVLAGLTQLEAAQRAGLDPRTVYAVEMGEATTTTTLAALALAYGIAPGELFEAHAQVAGERKAAAGGAR